MGELFDLVVVGGGLAGASLAKSMAEHGARVLVLERDEQFRDRVRGEMMIVGADGRSSMVCKTAGFHPVRDPDRLLVAGVLLDNVAAPEDTAKIVIDSSAGRSASIFPQGKGRARGYFCYYKNSRSRIQGDSAFADFVESCKRTGADGTRDCFSD
jgi:menaquinone-9 beta-reductase